MIHRFFFLQQPIWFLHFIYKVKITFFELILFFLNLGLYFFNLPLFSGL